MDNVTQPATASRPHHPFSPSTLQYREACAYYEPSQGDNEASRAGTLQHDAMDRGEDDERLTDQQAAAVAECLRYIDEVAAKYPGGTIIKEKYLPIDDHQIPYISFQKELGAIFGTTAGYLDFGVVSADETEAEIVDYKFGKWAVEPAENNLQGKSYLLGLFLKYPKLQKARVHFFMPHRDEADSHEFTRDDFQRMYLRIRTVVMRAIEARALAAALPNAFERATPNIGACVFCANVGRCDAVAKFALVIGHKFAPLHVPKEINPSLLRDPQDTGEGLRVASVIEAWAKAYRTQAGQKAIEDDGFVPDGYVLVSSQDREIVDKEKFKQVAREYLTDEEIETAVKISITPIEDLIKSKAARGTKEATREEFDAKLREAKAVELGAVKAFLRMDSRKKPKA